MVRLFLNSLPLPPCRTDFTLRHPPAKAAPGANGAAGSTGAAGQSPLEQELSQLAASLGLPVVLATPPDMVLDEPGEYERGSGCEGKAVGCPGMNPVDGLGGSRSPVQSESQLPSSWFTKQMYGAGAPHASLLKPSLPTHTAPSAGLRVWHKPDRAFGTPRACAYFRLWSPAWCDTARAAALSHLALKVRYLFVCPACLVLSTVTAPHHTQGGWKARLAHGCR